MADGDQAPGDDGDNGDDEFVWRPAIEEDGTVPYRPPLGPDGRPIRAPHDERPWYERVPWWGWLLIVWGLLGAIALVAFLGWCFTLLNGGGY